MGRNYCGNVLIDTCIDYIIVSKLMVVQISF